MKKNLKKIALLAFSAIFTVGLFAQDVDIKAMVPPKYYDKLMSEGKVLFSSDGSKGFQLLPNTYYTAQIRDSEVTKEDKNFPFVYEGLYYLSKKDILKTSNSSKSTITIDDVARVCRSVSKMEGMEYYSHRRKDYEILYEEAYMIREEDLDKRKPEAIPDLNYGSADGQVSYCLQKDSSFGRNKYKLSYHQKDNELYTQFVLMDKMGAGPFNALYPGKMKINLLVVDCGDNLLLYLCTDVDSKKFPGIEGMIVDSMTARMEAVYNWFLKQF